MGQSCLRCTMTCLGGEWGDWLGAVADCSRTRRSMSDSWCDASVLGDNFSGVMLLPLVLGRKGNATLLRITMSQPKCHRYPHGILLDWFTANREVGCPTMGRKGPEVHVQSGMVPQSHWPSSSDATERMVGLDDLEVPFSPYSWDLELWGGKTLPKV